MRRDHVRRPSAGTILGLIALVVAMGGTGYAAPGGSKKAAAKFYGPNDWGPNDSRVGYQHEFLGQIVCTSSPHEEGGQAFSLSLDNLPDGASITKVTAYYGDTEPDEHLTFGVGFSRPGLSDFLEGFPSAESVDGPGVGDGETPSSVELVPTSPVLVDNANRRYLASANFSACGTTDEDGFPSLALDGVRVDYTLK